MIILTFTCEVIKYPIKSTVEILGKQIFKLNSVYYYDRHQSNKISPGRGRDPPPSKRDSAIAYQSPFPKDHGNRLNPI